jgi:hypothetical protein
MLVKSVTVIINLICLSLNDICLCSDEITNNKISDFKFGGLSRS